MTKEELWFKQTAADIAESMDSNLSEEIVLAHLEAGLRALVMSLLEVERIKMTGAMKGEAPIRYQAARLI